MLEKWRKIKYFPSKIYMVPSLKLSIVIWMWYIALKVLWRIWESDVNKVASFHTFFQIFYKKFKILVLNCKLSHLYQFSRRSTKNLPTCPDVRSLLFLSNKKWHKKFAPILIVCQRWRHSWKTQTGITFDLDMILTWGDFFKSHIFWRCFSWKNKITYFFWSAVPL